MLLNILDDLVFTVFCFCFLIITFSFLNRFYILVLYRKSVKINELKPSRYFQTLPYVTVQLPIYNEPSVVGRLIDNICCLDYPRDKLEIQVLDDSTDITKEMIRDICERKRSEGINIKHIHRASREGYKAGALQHALESAKGEFIAIFDADFLPPADFLQKTVHFFTDAKIGWVQTSWAHLNENFSLLTQCIALFCDAMFKVESAARSKLKHWGIFNGTAGIIRKDMIVAVGGWQWDTITEDSDLSYRALTQGWQYVMLTETTCPCELPPFLPAFIEQQTRWSKGNIQVIKKLFKNILLAKVGVLNKFNFITYLTNYLFFPAVTLFSVMLFPYLLRTKSVAVECSHPFIVIGQLSLGFITLSAGITLIYFFFKFAQKQKKSNSYLLLRSMIFIFMSVGLAPFITVAIFEGFFKKDKVFVRTPKFDVMDNTVNVSINSEVPMKTRWIAFACILLGLYILVGMIITLTTNTTLSLKFVAGMILYFTSYTYFGLLVAFPNNRFLRNIFHNKRLSLITTNPSVGIS